MSEDDQLHKQVFIKNLSGKSFVFAYTDKTKFENLCEFASERFGMSKDQVFISYLVKSYNYAQHKDLLLEKDLDIEPNKTLFLILKLLGGSI